MVIQKDPIAVIGIACRFPGDIVSPEAYWNFLCKGGEAISEIGPDRWATDYYFHPDPKTPGKSYTWSAGVLSNIGAFDARFFGISPREAVQMDPQQRILLELAWEALEDAGQLPQRLAGTDCGVYIGISAMDYANSRLEDPSSGDAYFMTGGVLSIAANRISYFLDLHGPSMSIDTACSSSLVAVHQACESMARGECSMALVGGVNLLLTPYPFIGFSKASMLSPTGRCHAFDASADGYVRAEGGAVLFLKPLERARADGDPVRAVIVASGTNSDGRTSGLSLPNEKAQQQLLNSVYACAGLEPGDLRYIEAHGTGTAVGDPIEANAIGHAVAAARDHDDPLLIGSVKTNIGHLEPAAGVAGLLKVILALEHNLIPPTLHFKTPNPNIRFDDLNLRVVTELTPLSKSDNLMAMGVNSFGFGGTNAHVVVRQHRKPAGHRQLLRREIRIPLILSAQTEEALLDAAFTYRDHVRERESEIYDICYTAALRRQRFEQRLAVLGNDPKEISARLDDFVSRRSSRGIVSGRALGRPAKLALLFSGNGAQWPGMGRRLLEQDSEFRRWVGRVDELFRPMAGLSILEELQQPPENTSLHLTEVAQPALFALQVGLLECLLSKGLQPEAVFGHSVGEVAAAYASGAYTLEQATRVIYERSMAQAITRGRGKLAAVGMPAEAVREELAVLGGELEIGAVNSPSSVTVTGPESQLEALGARIEKHGALFRILDLEYPFHSRMMDPLHKGLVTALSGLNSYNMRVPFISTVTGAVLDQEYLDAEYWWQNVRRPVRLDKAMETLMADGFQVYMEIGPHCILQGYLLENLKAAGHAGRPVPTLQRGKDDDIQLMEALCTTHVLGCPLDLGKLFPMHGEIVRLPHYPWQRESIWYEPTREAMKLMNRVSDHPLLGYPVPHMDGVWENEIDLERMPWLADHLVGGSVIFPAAGFVEMAIAAAKTIQPGASAVIEYLEIRAPLILAGGVTKRARLRLTSADGGFSIQSHTRLSKDPWITHVTGRISQGTLPASVYGQEPVKLAADNCRIDAADIYRHAESLGLVYGNAFQKLAYVECGSGTGVAYLKSEDEQHEDNDPPRYDLRAARLDACFHGLIGLARDHIGGSSSAAYIPVHTGRIVHATDDRAFTQARIRLTDVKPHSVTACFELVDDSGGLVAVLNNVRFRRVQLVRDESHMLPIYENVAVRHFPKRLERAGDMPAIKTLVKIAGASLGAHNSAPQREAYIRRGLPAMEKLVAMFAAAAIGQAAEPGKWMTRNQLASALEVCDEQRPWFGQLLMQVEAAGFLDRDDGKVSFAATPSLEETVSRWRAFLADYPGYHTELTLVGRCGMHLRELLSGALEPEALNSTAALASVRAALPGFRSCDGMLRDLIRHLADVWSDTRPLRILELGLEGDPTDIRLKDGPDTDRVEHVYVCCRRAASREDDSGSTPAGDACQTLELISEDAADPLVPGSFDVAVVSHLLHELDEPEAAMRQMRDLLAGNGLLLVAEPLPTPAVDFIRGSVPGWWRAAEARLGYRSCLRTPGEWRESLLEAGFKAVESVCEEVEGVRGAGAMLIARNGLAAEETGACKENRARTILLLADHHGQARNVADHLERALSDTGYDVIVVQDGAKYRRASASRFVVNPDQAGDFARVFEILEGENKTCADIVHLMGLTLKADDDATELLDVQKRRCFSTICMVQALLAVKCTPSPRMWLVTGRAGVLDFADAAGDRSAIPSQSPLWGLGRVIANEHSDMECHLVDLWIDDGVAEAARLIAGEIEHEDGETEVVLTKEGRYVSRLRRAEVRAEANRATAESLDDQNPVVVLHSQRPGSLSQLQWKTVERKKPKAGEVEVRPLATGLNFRDLMFASGLLPEEAIENGYAGATLGMECAGVVTDVGPDVSEFRIGDEVVGFAPACFSTRIVARTRTFVKKPSGWSFEQAATVPVAFFTVVYALRHLARVERGERVLIHGAAGAVGIAAIQYAQHCGAEIFATAGSEEKRDFLRLLGVQHVLDSRTLAFADKIMSRTEEEGVDVVLNSLSGEALSRSLSVLRPFGRFLELGKRDFYENTRIGLRPFRENLSYFGIDADQLLIERPDIAQRVFAEVMALFDQGVFSPLPHRVFPSSRADDAFRYMQRSEHIGKIVVAHEHSSMAVSPEAKMGGEYALKTDATYLVTGGLSGFGLATARWMVERGARCLVLLGRSGARTDEAQAKVDELKDLGAAVHVLQADVTDYKSLKNAFDRIDGELPPLRGLVHSAMVVDDKLVRDLDEKRMRRVLSPKVLGAWNLHALTRKRKLDFFVLYSSATTSFGNPGLGNYVAANVYLESLARFRRSQGLPATAVSWGPISDSGYLARNDAALEALTAFMGSSGLTTQQGFKVLEQLLQANIVCGAVLEFDWSVIRRALPAAHLRRYELFNRERGSEDAGEQPERSVKQILAQLPPEDARAVITETVTQIAGKIMRLSPDQVDHDASIAELGMDSLMAIEMHMSINNQLGVNMPVMGLADIPTLTQLVDKIIEHAQPGGAKPEEKTEEGENERRDVRAGTGD